VDRILFALWCFLVALADGLVGLVLGNLRLPATVLVAASPGAAAGANLGISAISAATASIAHIRAGRVNWKLFAWMVPPLRRRGRGARTSPTAAPDWGALAVGAAASIPGALLGARLTGRLSEAELVRAIAVVLLIAAAAMVAQAVT
jgi:uncharacterized membrane protein YfcA